MRTFAADCVPQLAKACGGLKVNPDVAPNLEVGEAGRSFVTRTAEERRRRRRRSERGVA